MGRGVKGRLPKSESETKQKQEGSTQCCEANTLSWVVPLFVSAHVYIGNHTSRHRGDERAPLGAAAKIGDSSSHKATQTSLTYSHTTDSHIHTVAHGAQYAHPCLCLPENVFAQ